MEQINRREVAAHRAEAAASVGLARQAHLADAIEIARARGLLVHPNFRSEFPGGARRRERVRGAEPAEPSISK